jgi:hypothetical protein
LFLSQSIAATFERKQTALPAEVPLALSDSFSKDRGKITQWNAFIRKNRLPTAASLAEVTAFLTDFLMPPVRAIQEGSEFNMAWLALGPWKPTMPA